MNRRQFTQLALYAGSLAPFITIAQAIDNYEQRKSQVNAASAQAHKDFMGAKDVKIMGSEKIAMLMYPGFYAPDLINPQFLFSTMRGAKIYLISPTDDLTPVDAGGVSITPTHTRSQCPDDLAVLFVPGGAVGTLKAMKAEPFIDFIKAKSATAKYITSVCTGSLLLGKAGVLTGKKATSHWTTLELLSKFGATPVNERVVWDGNVVTGGGVTAGLDFGLSIIGALRGKKYAEAIQLQAEYDPAPPYNSGSPEKADPFIRENVRAMFSPLLLEMALAI